MYEVLLERRVEKQLDKLPAEAYQRVLESLNILCLNPRPAGCRKLSGSDNDWRIRVGPCRVLYEIDDRDQTIRINWIGDRKDAY